MAGKGTRHRFELSRLEIAGVVVSAMAGLFVVFLLGIYAGRGLADRRVDGGEQIVRVPVAPAVEQTPNAEEGLTFYDTLGRDERAAKPKPRADERPSAPAPADAVAEAPADRVGERLAAREPMVEPTVERETVARADAPAKPEAAKPDVSKPESEVKPQPAASPAPPKVERAPAPPSTARVAVALAPGAVATPAPRSGKGDWSVQVSATRDPRTADAILRRLKTKGYEAFVLKVRRRGETFYRVRVGHFASLEEAQQVVSRLRREPGVPEAFVASD
jgi:cell division septation protein DedD